MSSPTSFSSLLIGAHTSTAGGAWKAAEAAASIGATMLQLFTANQRQWHPAPLSQEAITQFHNTRQATEVQKVMSHGSYLINLASPHQAAREKSRTAFCKEIERCIALGVDFLNFHPGAALGESKALALDHLVEELYTIAPLLAGSKLRLLIETTAGQGTLIGSTFEEIAYIVKACEASLPIGVCVDTCHIFAAGYDIRTAANWHATLDLLDNTIGLSYLYALHINDSMHDLGSKKDRHAPLGAGKIGLASFAFLVQDPRTATLPMCLETPGGLPLWEKEIMKLRTLATSPSS